MSGGGCMVGRGVGLADGGLGEIEEAIAAATRGFEAWRRIPSSERARILRRMTELMRERREYLALLITLELGKPIADARLEVEQAAGMFEWNARGKASVWASDSRKIRKNAAVCGQMTGRGVLTLERSDYHPF